jgi:hypothetical protein
MPVNLSVLFVKRPVATTLLTLAIALAGFFAYFKLPVAPLPQVAYLTIWVFTSMPGASPETMAATVATPLERHLGVIADVTEMTSENTLGPDEHHAAIWPQSEHRWRRARCTSGDRCGARRSPHHAAPEPELRQGRSCRTADRDPGDDLGQPQQCRRPSEPQLSLRLAPFKG